MRETLAGLGPGQAGLVRAADWAHENATGVVSVLVGGSPSLVLRHIHCSVCFPCAPAGCQAEQEEARKLEEEIERRPDERVCIGLTLPWERAGRFLLVLRLKLRSPVCKGRCHVTVSE